MHNVILLNRPAVIARSKEVILCREKCSEAHLMSLRKHPRLNPAVDILVWCGPLCRRQGFVC